MRLPIPPPGHRLRLGPRAGWKVAQFTGAPVGCQRIPAATAPQPDGIPCNVRRNPDVATPGRPAPASARGRARPPAPGRRCGVLQRAGRPLRLEEITAALGPGRRRRGAGAARGAGHAAARSCSTAAASTACASNCRASWSARCRRSATATACCCPTTPRRRSTFSAQRDARGDARRPRGRAHRGPALPRQAAGRDRRGARASHARGRRPPARRLRASPTSSPTTRASRTGCWCREAQRRRRRAGPDRDRRDHPAAEPQRAAGRPRVARARRARRAGHGNRHRDPLARPAVRVSRRRARPRPRPTARASRGRRSPAARTCATSRSSPSTARTRATYDDAVYCERTRGGGWRLIVAIADVGHYVRPGSALDAEARERGTSVYFPNRVLPMLPEALSNGLCSLVPDEDRLCLCCELRVSDDGRITRSRFFEGVMRSAARLTYREVGEFLARPEGRARAAPRSAARAAAGAARRLPQLHARAQRTRRARARHARAQAQVRRAGPRRGAGRAAAQRRAPADRGVHDRGQHRGGALPRPAPRADAVPRARPAGGRPARDAAPVPARVRPVAAARRGGEARAPARPAAEDRRPPGRAC